MGITNSEVKTLELDQYDKTHFSGWRNKIFHFNNFRSRWPWLWEDLTGFNMQWHCAQRVPDMMFETDIRTLMKGNEVEDLKSLVFREVIKIDDPIDKFSKHTMLHDSVIMSREQIFYFLLQQGANPMVRCTNGYTPMLKAAAMCKSDFV